MIQDHDEEHDMRRGLSSIVLAIIAQQLNIKDGSRPDEDTSLSSGSGSKSASGRSSGGRDDDDDDSEPPPNISDLAPR